MRSHILLATAAVTAGFVIIAGQMHATADDTAAMPTAPASADAPSRAAAGGTPDVYVWSISGTANWSDATHRAYSVGTTSCNQGTAPLDWWPADPRHPVIAQAMFRLKPDAKGHGRFEQLGQSWLKHGFCALDQSDCGTCESTGCFSLGVGCSDPYTASRNGNQMNPRCGPKYQVNPTTGVFDYPPADPAWSGDTARRLRVLKSDVELATNPGATYYIQAQYVHYQDAPDDGPTAANNASYRRANLSPAGNMGSFTGTTQHGLPAIKGWQVADPAVVLQTLTVPLEGTLHVAHRAYDNGDGTWDYEYAVHNLDLDRSVGAFTVPVPAGVTVTDIGFHDVDYHSGDGDGNVNYDGTDWPGVHADGAVTWATEDFAANASANAIRWGTLYNFRFTADGPPADTPAALGLFKPGTPDGVAVTVAAPQAAPCAADVDGSGAVGFNDVLEVLTSWGPCGGCAADVDGSGVVGFGDILEVLTAWGPC